MPPPVTSLPAHMLAFRGRVALGFAAVVGHIAGSLYLPFVLRGAIDRLATATMTPATMVLDALRYAGIGICVSACAVLMRRLLLGVSHRVEYRIRRDVFAHLTRLDYNFYQRERTGDLMTKMSSDLGAVRELVGQGLLQGCRIVVGFPLAFGIMFALNVRLALTVAALLPVISLVFFVLIRFIRRYYDLCQEQFSAIANFAQETFAGFRTVKGFGIEERQRGRFRELNEEYIRRNLKLARIEEPAWPFMMFMFTTATVLLLVIGGRLVIRGELTLGEFVQFQQYLMFLAWPMLAIGWTINIIQRGIGSWKRIRTILDAVPDIANPPDPPPEPVEVRGDIRFERVSLSRGGTEILRDLSLTIPEGQCVAITGPTGGGKTLFVSLLVRLLDPTAGRVTIGGVDVRRIPLATLRRQIGMAPQEPFLFSDTLANNLGLGLEEDPAAGRELHDEKIQWASEIAQLKKEVDRFPLKFETMLGERGVTLSGGQRQRTAIARAVARKPNLLILDDVFSAVDTQTEAGILEGLLPVLQGRTCLFISHRVSTLRHADRILVLDRGRIVQDGTHAELVARPGYYRDLDEVQRLQARLESA